MKPAPLPSAVPVPVPSLPDVLNDPTVLHRLPLDVLLALRQQVGYLGADLEAAITCQSAQTHPRPELGVLLDVEEAAKRLNTSPDSLYRKHKRLRPGYIISLDGRLRFTKPQINDILAVIR